MGVPGAIAEFDAATDAPQVELANDGDVATVTAIGTTGALRLHIDGSTRAFAFAPADEAAATTPETVLLATPGTGLPSRRGLTELGPDPHPIVGRAAANGVLFDLGLGRGAAAFMVRVEEVGLMASLRACTGASLGDITEDVWQALVAGSPTRVVETVLGRIEVSAPIPPPGGQSPVGSHTHLLPDTVAGGLDLPHGMTIPPGWWPGPVLYPSDTSHRPSITTDDGTAPA